MKTCTKCEVEQPVSEYSKHPSGKNGLQPVCRTCNKVINRAYRQRIKDKVFDLLGRACVCCGEKEPTFLTLDHKNNDGAEHRRELGAQHGASSTDKVWRWLTLNPEEAYRFQILCYNCNCGKRDNGGVCPHKLRRPYGDSRPASIAATASHY